MSFSERGTIYSMEDLPLMEKVNIIQNPAQLKQVLLDRVDMGPSGRFGKKALECLAGALDGNLCIGTQGLLKKINHPVRSESLRADPHSLEALYQATGLWLCPREHLRVQERDALRVEGCLLVPDACNTGDLWPLCCKMAGGDGGSNNATIMRSFSDVYSTTFGGMRQSLRSKEDVLEQARLMRCRAEMMLSCAVEKQHYIRGGTKPAIISQMQPCLVVSRYCSVGAPKILKNGKARAVKGYRILLVITFDYHAILKNPITVENLRTTPRVCVPLLLYLAMCHEQEDAFWSLTHAEALAGLTSTGNKWITAGAKRVLSIALDSELMQGFYDEQETVHHRIDVIGKLIIHQMNELEPRIAFEHKQELMSRLLMAALRPGSQSNLRVLGTDLLSHISQLVWTGRGPAQQQQRRPGPVWGNYGLHREYLGHWRTAWLLEQQQQAVGPALIHT